MRWNWTQPDWPNFRFDSAAVEPLERRFLLSSGEILGAVRHVSGDERDRLRGTGQGQRAILSPPSVRPEL